MNPIRLIAFPIAVALVAGCTTPHAHGPGHQAAMSDACTAHRQARTPEERRAAAEAHIVRMHGSADAAHIERHLGMMDQRCAAAR